VYVEQLEEAHKRNNELAAQVQELTDSEC